MLCRMPPMPLQMKRPSESSANFVVRVEEVVLLAGFEPTASETRNPKTFVLPERS